MSPVKRHWIELAAAILTGLGHLVVVEGLGIRFGYMAAAIAGWTAYIVWRLIQSPALAREWRLLGGNLKAHAGLFGFCAVAGAALLGLGRWLNGPLPWKTIAILLAAYPLWGILQQFMLQTFVSRTLARILPLPAAILLASIGFGLVHAPDWPLAGLCALAGLAWVTLYHRGANVLALGVCHGWLGTLAYVALLGRDPIRDYLGPILGSA